MKQNIHPQYFADTKIKCACGAEYKIGSTKEKTEVEICANCHPFFTGKQKLVDTAGRVERFKAKVKKAETVRPKKSKKK